MICDLPPRAVELLLVIVTNHHQREPITYSSLMERTGFARSVVYRHLANLEAAGFVRRTPGTRGTLRPTVRLVPIAIGEKEKGRD